MTKSSTSLTINLATPTQDSINNIDQVLVNMDADHPGDIIADILHWCDHYNEDFEDLLRRGRDYHDEELATQHDVRAEFEALDDGA